MVNSGVERQASMSGERLQKSILAPAEVCGYLYNSLWGFMGNVNVRHTTFSSFVSSSHLLVICSESE